MFDAPSSKLRVAPFSEKNFYLSELRDRTIAIAGHGEEFRRGAVLEAVLKDLEANRTRVVFLSDCSDALASGLGIQAIAETNPAQLPGPVWRGLGKTLRVGVVTDPKRDFVSTCSEVVLALGIEKLVWVDGEGGLVGANGERNSFVDSEALRARIDAAPRGSDLGVFLAGVEAMLSGGVSAVNLCTLEGISDELFTYNGSGTLFTSAGYIDVRGLGIDDFDAAADLIERGVAEGYLAPRSPAQVERVLESAFGAFVGGNHLAGIGSLLLYGEEEAAEIGSLYTLTRFLGEGVGSYLVHFAVERAKAYGCQYAFAVTTSDRVVAFFERNGFALALSDQVPGAKWQDYDPERRSAARCLRLEL
jgi:N-acetylglutamate synthase-like GNAT family acetyltransferase